MERRLAAVLAIDMVGYSRLMGVDEQGTLAAHQRHKRKLLGPRAAQYHGRTIKFTGDGALMEFASVVDSVCFAVEVQLALRAENEGYAEDRRYLYRIAVNIGDIIPADGDIFGDGVNVAARLEELADPGGVCLSAAAFDQVKGKLDLTFEYAGETRVKNISEPLTYYRVQLDDKAALLATPEVPEVRAGRMALRRLAIGICALLVAAGALVWWQPWTILRPPPPIERFAYPLPDKPSVAVLPFINVSGDTEQDRLAEGLTDDLIIELSKVSGVFVIARHSVLAVSDTASGDPGRRRGTGGPLHP